MKINSRIKSKKFTSATAAVLAAAVVIGGGTWLNLDGRAESASGIDVDLKEVRGAELNYTYDIIPGTTQTKDPVITLKNDAKAYLFVEVTDNTQGVVTYDLTSNGWSEITAQISESKRPANGTEVYARMVDENSSGQEFHIISDDKVSYDTGITVEQLSSVSGASLSFKAKAIEAAPFSDAVEAYERFDAPEQTVSSITRKTTSGANIGLNNTLADSAPLSGLTDEQKNDFVLTVELGGNLTSEDTTDVNIGNVYNNVVLDGGNDKKEISFEDDCDINYGKSGQNLTLKNVSLSNSYSLVSMFFAAIGWPLGPLGNITVVDMTKSDCVLNLDNVTITDSRASSGAATNSAIRVKADNNTINIKNADIQLASSEKLIIVDSGCTNVNINIESGTFSGKLDNLGSAAVQITGGTFSNTGLTFTDFQKLVPSGYTATQNGNTYTVTKNS